jgi:hypothetical protein
LSQHTIMRRSTRIRWQIPVQITSVDARVPFNETCETVAVNAHGCGVICRTPLEKGTAIKIGLLPDNREVMAHVADVVKLGEDGSAWLLGLQLDAPANVWGVRNPPHDWEKGITGQPAEPAAAALAASAAAGAGGSSVAVSPAPTLAAPEFSMVSPAPPVNNSAAVQSAALAEPPKVEPGKPTPAANNTGTSVQHAPEAGRNNGSPPPARPTYNIRDRDWVELRKQMEEHLQDLMWQVDDQVETKLEHWKEQMVDAEARLESLCQLQDRLQAHLTVLSEIVKEKVKPEESGASAEPSSGGGKSESRQEAAAGAESAAVTSSQVEEIRQLQQWMQSLIHLLPQAVEQHSNEAVAAAEQRLQAQAEEQLEGMRRQLAELQERLEAATVAKAEAEAGAAEEERRKAAEEALRAAGEEMRQSLQNCLREESEKLREQLKQAQQAAQEEAERWRLLQEEAAERAEQQSAEAGQRAEQLKAAEASVREAAEQVRAELRSKLQEELDVQKQQMQQTGAALEERATRLQAQIGELTADSEEARRARESLESVVASLTQAASQQIKDDVSAGLQRISGETRQESERREKEFAEKMAEAQRVGAATQEQLQELARQAGELSARLEESERRREGLQAQLTSAIAAAEHKVESSAAGILERVGSQSEEQIKRLEQQISAQQKKLDELSRQRQQEIQSALETHMAGLRNSSESALRKVSEELRGTLNHHLKEEFASQRHIWEKQREASQAEKTWVETRANELAGRWEARLQGYIERATGEAVNKLRTDVEKAAADIIREQMEEVEKHLSGSLEPLLSRADKSAGGLEKLLAAVQQERERVDAQNAAFLRQKDDAQGWMEKQMERLRQAVHDAVVETSGEIKGRIHMAVEMAREPIEQRSREAQRQVEELAERKSREVTDRLSEFEKAMGPRLQKHLAEVIEKFQKDTEEVAHKSVHRCQDDLAQTLESMLHLVRGQREGKSK